MRRPPTRRLISRLLLSLITAAGCTTMERLPAGQPSQSTIHPDERVLALGDWGAGTTDQAALAEQMSRLVDPAEVGAILTTGDNFYSDDAHSLMEPFEWATAAGIPFLVAWGNHDIDSRRRIEAVNEAFDHPPPWAAHRWGDIEIVILDSTQPNATEQREFLTATLAASDRPTIVVFHHPPYSCGSHGDTGTIREAWLSLFDGDVFLVLSGHEHNYQRFEVSDVTYVVSGGGGAALTELAPCSAGHQERVAGEAVHHFLAMEQDEGVVVTVIDADGQVADEFALTLP